MCWRFKFCPGPPRQGRQARFDPCLDFGLQYALIRNNRSKNFGVEYWTLPGSNSPWRPWSGVIFSTKNWDQRWMRISTYPANKLIFFFFSYELGLWRRRSSSKNSGWRSGGSKKHSLFETFWHYTRFKCCRRSLARTLRQSDTRILRRIRNYLFGFTPMGLHQCEHLTIFGLCGGIHQECHERWAEMSCQLSNGSVPVM